MCLDVLANQSDVDRRLLLLGYHNLPVLPKLSALDHVCVRNGHESEIEPASQERKELLLFQENRNLINGGHIADDEDLINFHGAV